MFNVDCEMCNISTNVQCNKKFSVSYSKDIDTDVQYVCNMHHTFRIICHLYICAICVTFSYHVSELNFMSGSDGDGKGSQKAFKPETTVQDGASTFSSNASQRFPAMFVVTEPGKMT